MVAAGAFPSLCLPSQFTWTPWRDWSSSRGSAWNLRDRDRRNAVSLQVSLSITIDELHVGRSLGVEGEMQAPRASRGRRLASYGFTVLAVTLAAFVCPGKPCCNGVNVTVCCQFVSNSRAHLHAH